MNMEEKVGCKQDIRYDTGLTEELMNYECVDTCCS